MPLPLARSAVSRAQAPSRWSRSSIGSDAPSLSNARRFIALVGAGITGWSIAATGDTLARAYALAPITRTKEKTINQHGAMERGAFLVEITENSGLDPKWRLAGESINYG